jgi:hypothetical protein
MPERATPRKLWRFHRPSFLRFVALFGTEVIIALFFRDPLIRQWLGDVLVVMLVAYFVHAFAAFPMRQIAIGAWLFAIGIELLQGLQLIERLGWQDSLLAHWTIGSTFDWKDIFAYTLGGLVIMVIHPNRKP